MPSRKGSGKPVTLAEKKRYEDLRKLGWSPDASAESIGRSRSWAYSYEKETDRSALRKRYEPVPNDDLSEAVELIVAIQHEDFDRAFRITDRFGDSMLPYLASVSWFLATERAHNLNDDLRAILKGSPMADELAAQEIGPQELLEMIPTFMAGSLAGSDTPIDWIPQRAQEWLDRFTDSLSPEDAESMQRFEDDLKGAFASGNPEAVDAVKSSYGDSGMNGSIQKR